MKKKPKDKRSALERARSALKKAEHSHSLANAKKKLEGKGGKI